MTQRQSRGMGQGMQSAREIALPGGGSLAERLRWLEENPPVGMKGSGDVSESDSNSERDPLATCSRCGGYVNEDSYPDGGSVCRCDGAMRRCRELVQSADPSGKMIFGSITSPDASLSEAVEVARRVVSGEELGLMMYGRPGVGKTHVAVALCRAAIPRRITAGFYNVAEIVGRVQDTYGGGEPGGASRTEILASVASREIVVLDDLGKEHQSSNVDSIIYELVNRIYVTGRRLVICTNLPPKLFKERYDEAVQSRIAAMCRAVRVDGEDRRKAVRR